MKQFIALSSFALVAAITPLRAQAASFSQLFVIGDSLVDPGNIFQATGGTIPQTPPYTGRFSDGPLWVELLAADFGLQPALLTSVPTGADISDGIYFAFGGAGTGIDNVLAPAELPGTGALGQAALFADLGLSPAEDVLFIYLSGANDFVGGATVAPATDPSVPLQNTAAALQLLAGAGGQNILISNLPDVSQSPRFAGLSATDAAALRGLVTDYNTGLSETVVTLSVALPEVNFIPFDLNGLLTDAIAAPADFGFTDVVNPCLGDFTSFFDTDFTLCESPENFLFWDDFHPTTQANQLIASTVLAQLQAPETMPETSTTSGVMALGLVTLGGWVARRLTASLDT